MKLNELNIKQARDGLKSKKFSSLDLTKNCLEEIEKKNKILNAFITVTEKNALEQAKKADNLISQGSNAPLLGIPIALKDLFLTKGIRTTAASNVLRNYIPQYDATVVSKIKDAGAIILGKVKK